MTRQISLRVAFFTALLLVALFFSVLLVACAGSDASYTRWRGDVTRGRMTRAEELRASELIDYHAADDAPRPPGPQPAGAGGLYLSAELGNARLPVTGTAHPLLQVSVRGAAGTARHAASVVLVVDTSGSMAQDEKIGAVRHAVARFLEQLHDDDHVGLVAFDSSARVLLELARVGDVRSRALALVGTLQPSGGTNLHAGLLRGIALARTRLLSRGVDRVVLLTDGLPTDGERAPEAFDALVRDAVAGGVHVTTIGVGRAIDDALLSRIARSSGGAYHYVDRADEVERVFGEELRSLAELAARDVALHIELPSGWTLVQSYDEQTRAQGATIVSQIGDLGGDEAAVRLYELSAPSAAAGANEELHVRVSLRPAEPSDAVTAPVIAAQRIIVTRDGSLPYDPAPGGAVLRNLVLGRTAVALRDTDLRLRGGDIGGALTALDAQLGFARKARARLVAAGEATRAGTLDEPLALLVRTRALVAAGVPSTPARASEEAAAASVPLTSSAYAGWDARGRNAGDD